MNKSMKDAFVENIDEIISDFKKDISAKAADWAVFAGEVMNHIDNYVVPQYGDKGADLATDYTAQQCVDNIKRYAHRFGQNSRPEETLRDLLKIAHYAQMAYTKAKQ